MIPMRLSLDGSAPFAMGPPMTDAYAALDEVPLFEP
jgi:hypothetical protein